eukprot:scaffold13142_cov45-Prasinocladus_malaysianus.AAC.2
MLLDKSWRGLSWIAGCLKNVQHHQSTAGRYIGTVHSSSVVTCMRATTRFAVFETSNKADALLAAIAHSCIVGQR